MNHRVVVEIADRPERAETFLPFLDEMVHEGIVAPEKVRINAIRAGGGGRGEAGKTQAARN